MAQKTQLKILPTLDRAILQHTESPSAQGALFEAKQEIIRLASIIEATADYHMNYFRRYEVTDPDRAQRHKSRATILLNALYQKAR